MNKHTMAIITLCALGLFSALVALLALVLVNAAQAGTITPVLQDTLAERSDGEDVAVIIRFAEEVDIKALRKELERLLKEQYPDPKERKAARKELKRSLLVDGLKQLSGREKRNLRDFLQENGVSGKLKDLWAINALAGTLPVNLVDPVADLTGVKSVTLDATVQGPGPGTAPTAPGNWNLALTGAPDLWQLGHTGTGAVVATMDSGADGSHPDLGPRWRGGANSWFDPYGQHAGPADLTGHGTRVLGLMVGGAAGGYQIGMAPDAQWIAAKVFDDANLATLSGIHQGFQWMLDPDGDAATDDAPDVVNNSWVLDGTEDECNQEFGEDIALLKEAEIAVVFAGGNYGPKSSTSMSPANDPMVLSVGALNDRYKVSRASSRGPGACDGGIYPRLVAPGDDVLTLDLMPMFYNVVSGTSFAVAHLSGGMALLVAAFPEATVTQLESALTATAIDLGDAGPDNSYGHGLMDVVAAHDWLELQLGGGDPDPGNLQLSASAYSVNENAASLTVTVTRTDGSSGEVSVDYATSDGSAIAGDDYQPTSDSLMFADGETSRSFSIGILDDAELEGDEDFVVSLSNPQGGATLGAGATAVATITDDDTAPSDDADGDGYTADVDCNDDDSSVHPGAQEIKHDGVDQDCNGYDLTIAITRAAYHTKRDQLTVYATSDLGDAAALDALVILEDGTSLARSMGWNSKRKRWEDVIENIATQFGAVPVSVTVSGVEGAESAPVD